MREEIDRIQPEPVHAAPQPEAAGFQQRVLYIGVMQIKLRLVGEKMVQVELPPPRLPRPGAATKHRKPVIRRRAVGLRIGPHEPVRLFTAGAAIAKPGMLRAGMAPNLIDQHTQTQLMGARHQRVEILQRAKQRVYGGVIRHVVAKILLRAQKNRAQPNRVHAQPRHMVKMAGDTWQVAHAVAVAIGKTARVDLINRRAAPPLGVLHARISSRDRDYAFPHLRRNRAIAFLQCSNQRFSKSVAIG